MASVRDVFFHKIYEMVQDGEDIVVVTSDLGAPSLDDFRKYYPERYISVGIAEQNLIAVASGLALSGKKTVAYGLNPFPVTRAFDQLRCLMAEMKIPVTLCGLNAGLCSAESGYTHMPVEDFGMVRMLPNLQIINPSDEAVSLKAAAEVSSSGGPRYIRFDKAISSTLYQPSEIDFSRGFSSYGNGRKDGLCIITNGCFVGQMRKIVDSYYEKGKKLRLLDIYSFPADRESLAGILKGHASILTIEENVLAGGLGSFILELLSDYSIQVPVKRLGLAKSSYEVFTDRSYIREAQGLDERNIRRVIDSLVISDKVEKDEI